MKCTEARKAYLKAYHAANKEKEKAYRDENREKIQARNAKYRADNPDHIREYTAEYNAKHREKRKAYDAEYRPKHIEARNADSTKSKLRHPERNTARRRVASEVTSGRYPPASAMVCRICGEAQAQQYHHHNGYGPGHEIDVIAVCIECHADAHRKYTTSSRRNAKQWWPGTNA